MKLFKIIKPSKVILDEALLSTEFKIGFELEAICDNPDLRKDGNLPQYHSGSTLLTGNVKKLFDLLNEKLGLGKGKIENDSSIRTYGFSSSAWTFEYGSPVIPFNPTNINKICNFLKDLRNYKIYTNNSCGFHTHISFPGLDKESIGWVMFSIANDPELYNEVTQLVVNTEVIDFFGGYAKKDYLDRMKSVGDEIKSNPSTRSTLRFGNEKYEVIRIHPKGTIEWRGPRGFLDSDKTVEYVEGYIKKLYKLVIKIGDIATRKEYNGFTKKDVLEHVIIDAQFDSEDQLKKDDKLKYRAKKIKDNPELLRNYNIKSLEKIYDSDRDLFNTNVKDWLKDNMDSMDTNRLKKIFEMVINLSNEYTIKSFFDDVFSGYTKISPELSETILLSLIEKGDSSSRFGSSTYEHWEGLKLLDIRDPELILRAYYIIKKGSGSNKQLKGYMPFFVGNENNLPLQFYTNVCKNDPELLFYFKRIPIKVQRIITKRSPWALQYINNPDPKLVNDLRAKFGNEIDDYIMNEV